MGTIITFILGMIAGAAGCLMWGMHLLHKRQKSDE